MTENKAKPFVKWVGGKRQLLSRLEKYIPDHIDTYYECFLGGGALFFEFHTRMNRAVLSDANEELMITYAVVKNKPDDLINQLHIHSENHSEEYFYEVRKVVQSDPVLIAARFIYLNKTCFNGLYRVNKKGLFNTPIGSQKNPNICDTETIFLAHEALKKATLRVQGFDKIKPDDGDFVYCDPPYFDTFVDYQAGGFSPDDQKILSMRAKEWRRNGSRVLLSNSNTDYIKSLYQSFCDIEVVDVIRSINSDASNRKDGSEVIINAR